jgi:uroporphyrinogen decarboxylase
MTGKERILKAIAHEEADRIPIDMGASLATTINVKAYAALLKYLGFSDQKIKMSNILSQLAYVDEAVSKEFDFDARGIFPDLVFSGSFFRENSGSAVVDEWGIKWFMPDANGHYYDMVVHPLTGSTEEDVDHFEWADGANPARFASINAQIGESSGSQAALVLGNTIGNGIFQTGNWLEGYEDFLCDLALETNKAAIIMDRTVEAKMLFWDTLLGKWGHKLDIVLELDDMGTQSGLIMSPELYRKMVKPRQKRLFEFIKKKAPHVKLMFHSCGSIKPIIPDLIEAGVDILNPVQISAANMNPAELKRDFGKDLTFWGGGVDTQNVLSRCTPDQVEYEVRKNIELFAPGGGYVFAQVHNIQEEVPPENLVRMWETVLRYGRY